MKLRPSHVLMPIGAFGVAALVLYAVVYGDQSTSRIVAKERSGVEERFRNQMQRTANEYKTAGYDATLDKLRRINERKLPRHRRALWFAALADVQQKKARHLNVSAEHPDAKLALKYFRRTIPITKEQDDRNDLHWNYGSFLMYLGLWEAASQQFVEIDRGRLDEVAHCKLMDVWAQVLQKQGFYPEALGMLDEILENCAAPVQRAELMATKADVLVAMHEENEAIVYAAHIQSNSLLDDAGNLYREAEALISPSHAVFWRPIFGQLRLAVMNGDATEAYALANRIQTGPAGATYKQQSVLALVQLEENRNEPQRAGNLLDTYLERFTNTPGCRDVLAQLYHNMMARGLHNEAVAKVDELFGVYGDRPLAGIILSDLIPRLFAQAASETPLAYPWDYARIRSLSAKMRSVTGSPHVLMNAESFLDGLTEFVTGRFDIAEARFGHYIESGETGDYREPVLYLDLLAGLQLERNAAVTARRAERYMVAFPKGENHHHVLQILLAAYYELGLIEQALTLARRTFIHEIAKLGNDGGFSSELRWVSTVTRIALCYDQLGQHARADRLFRLYENRILAHPVAPTIFSGWAESAASRGQGYEAIRRYDLIVARTPDVAERMRLRVARIVLLLGTKLPDALAQGEAFAGELRAFTEFSDAEQQKHLRTVFEALLAHAMARQPERTDAIMKECIAVFANAPWLDYWKLKSLDLEDLALDLKATSGAYNQLIAEKGPGSGEASSFLKRQVSLIDSLLAMEERASEMQRRGLNP